MTREALKPTADLLVRELRVGSPRFVDLTPSNAPCGACGRCGNACGPGRMCVMGSCR